jgi:transposase-like protein
MRDVLYYMMELLNPREREVVERVCLDGSTLQSVASDWGVTRELIRSVKQKAIVSLRNSIRRGAALELIDTHGLQAADPRVLKDMKERQQAQAEWEARQEEKRKEKELQAKQQAALDRAKARRELDWLKQIQHNTRGRRFTGEPVARRNNYL